MVVYPHGVHPLFVGTESSIRALDAAMADDKQILLLAKRDADLESPARDDLFTMGTVATVLQLLKLPDGTVKVLVEGGHRASVGDLEVGEDFSRADVQRLDEPEVDAREAETLVRSIMEQDRKSVV